MKFKMVILSYLDSTFKKVSLIIFLLSAIFPIIIGNSDLITDYLVVPEKHIIRLKSIGSTSMSRMINVLSDEFTSNYKDYHYEKSESGTGVAPIMVKLGSADLGDMSRDLDDNEKTDYLKTKCIALDGIVVVLNNSNKIANLSKNEIKDIFSKKIVDWSQVSDNFSGKIVTIGREEGSGTKSGFEQKLGIENVEYDLVLSESGDISAKVSNEPRAIGYISLSSVFGAIHGVSVDNVECNLQNIKDGSYALTRPFLQVYNINIKNDARDKWFEFLKSDGARELIEGEKLVYVNQ